MCKTSTDLYQLTLTYCMSCNSNLIGQKYQIQPKKKNTILPDAKMSAVVFGSLILIITAAKRCKDSKDRHKHCR